MAPDSISSTNMPSWLYSTAMCNGVCPSLFLISILALFFMSSCTIRWCPLLVAQCRGAVFCSSCAFTLAPFCMRACAIFVYPFIAAQCNGVDPYLSLADIRVVCLLIKDMIM